jgi:fructosamine-3-kinase
MSIERIIEACGLKADSYYPVAGGDISQAWCVCAESRKYFFKLNSAARFPDMFSKEKKGLETLAACCSLYVPAPIGAGVYGSGQYLILEWLEKGSMTRDFWEDFGSGLARLHQREHECFGWEEDNYIGSLVQTNARQLTWAGFYADSRILPFVKVLRDKGQFSKDDVSAAEKLCGRLRELFPNEKPALLHGDLWSGNFMVGPTGHAAVYDPAVYFGHREMDLGMTLLFGGFDQAFYEAYQSVYPLEKNWKQRLWLTQLYPLLVHAVLFGGNYTLQAQRSLRNGA